MGEPGDILKEGAPGIRSSSAVCDQKYFLMADSKASRAGSGFALKTVEPSSFRDVLSRSGFKSFLWTQFLGTLNDILYKVIVSMRAVQLAASSGASAKYLSLAGAVFVIPFLLFSGYSGYLADRFSKRTVLISVKVFEIFAMGLGLASFFSSNIDLMLAVLFLMALHSTIFSPAKYGIVGEIVREQDLSRANGLLEMSTFIAIALGISGGSFLSAAWADEPWKMGGVVLAIAVTGLLVSLGITRVKAAHTGARFPINPLSEVIQGTRSFLRDRPVLLAVIGISYLWFLGAMFQMDLLVAGSEAMKLSVGLMVTSLAVGVGAGGMLAGRLSGDKVELGLVPIGAALMGVSCIGAYFAIGSYAASMVCLGLLGLGSGLFLVPLNAYLQQRSGATEKGRILATNNFYNMLAVVPAWGTMFLLNDRWHFSADKMLLVFGAMALLVSFYVARLIPEFLVRFSLWMMMHALYRIRIEGRENIPFRGPALLVANHTTHGDGFFLNATMQRLLRFMIWKPYYEHKAMHWFFKFAKAIPVGTSGPRDTVAQIRAARKELIEGHVVGIFAEGAITRTGNLLPMKRGMERILEGLEVPIIPVHIDNLWGSLFSFSEGRFFWKRPRQFRRRVTVSFGSPMAPDSKPFEVQQAVAEMASRAVEFRKTPGDTLPRRFLRSARRNWSRLAMADSTGRELKYGQALTASLLVSRWLRKERPAESMIGVMLPSTVAGALVNAGISMAGGVPVNLNFTAGAEAMRAAVEQCRIRTIVTSKKFLEKAGIELMDGMVFVEDLFAAAGGFAKIRALLAARLAPALWLCPRVSPDSLATIIFSSGSTGEPKGVMLSHYNVIANIEAMVQVFWLTERDRIVGVLPFFHSFGFTVTLWLPLVDGCGAVYHSNPTDAKTIGEMVEKYQGTLLLSTPTFCAGYARKCTREQFASLRYVLVGAEKLREPVRRMFEEAFGLELLEGYGCTEMSPVVAVNAPGYEAGRDTQIGTKHGTVGHTLPGVAAKVVDLETREPLGSDREGLLMVRGANRMIGYWNDPERTAAATEDGWYRTGDLAVMDEDGFLRITDRLSRFSKIGGEMVPHLKIEEAACGLIGEAHCAVTGVPDLVRGERLVLLYVSLELKPDEVWRRLSESDLPKLWLPKRDNIYQVECLPTLGTGKLDLRAVRMLAEQFAGINVSAVK